MSALRDASAGHRGHRLPDIARPILGGIILLWGAGCAPALHPHAMEPVDVQSRTSSFVSNGHRIQVDVYRPVGDGRRPAVLVLHGSSGVHRFVPNTATRYARALAEQGLITFVVHYFDATGTVMASRAAESKHYFVWANVMKDAMTWAARFPGVDPNEVGLLGHSLGAFLAVGVAAFDPRVSRVVLLGGGLEPFLEDKIQHMPPTLIFHGDMDEEVPLSDANRLVDFLRARRFDVQIRVVPGGRHALSEQAVTEALTEAARFFTPELRGETKR